MKGNIVVLICTNNTEIYSAKLAMRLAKAAGVEPIVRNIYLADGSTYWRNAKGNGLFLDKKKLEWQETAIIATNPIGDSIAGKINPTENEIEALIDQARNPPQPTSGKDIYCPSSDLSELASRGPGLPTEGKRIV